MSSAPDLTRDAVLEESAGGADGAPSPAVASTPEEVHLDGEETVEPTLFITRESGDGHGLPDLEFHTPTPVPPRPEGELAVDDDPTPRDIAVSGLQDRCDLPAGALTSKPAVESRAG